MRFIVSFMIQLENQFVQGTFQVMQNFLPFL